MKIFFKKWLKVEYMLPINLGSTMELTQNLSIKLLILGDPKLQSSCFSEVNCFPCLVILTGKGPQGGKSV